MNKMKSNFKIESNSFFLLSSKKTKEKRKTVDKRQIKLLNMKCVRYNAT